jgi:hypothetical protein
VKLPTGSAAQSPSASAYERPGSSGRASSRGVRPARRTLDVYREGIGAVTSLSRRRSRTGHARELERSLPALTPQVDELVVISNVPGSVGESTTGARVLENAHPVLVRRERQPRRRGDVRRAHRDLESGRLP